MEVLQQHLVSLIQILLASNVVPKAGTTMAGFNGAQDSVLISDIPVGGSVGFNVDLRADCSLSSGTIDLLFNLVHVLTLLQLQV